MTSRTDPHRPGAIVPSDYVCLVWYALPDSTIPGDRGCGMQEVRQLLESIDYGSTSGGYIRASDVAALTRFLWLGGGLCPECKKRLNESLNKEI